MVCTPMRFILVFFFVLIDSEALNACLRSVCVFLINKTTSSKIQPFQTLNNADYLNSTNSTQNRFECNDIEPRKTKSVIVLSVATKKITHFKMTGRKLWFSQFFIYVHLIRKKNVAPWYGVALVYWFKSKLWASTFNEVNEKKRSANYEPQSN